MHKAYYEPSPGNQGYAGYYAGANGYGYPADRGMPYGATPASQGGQGGEQYGRSQCLMQGSAPNMPPSQMPGGHSGPPQLDYGHQGYAAASCMQGGTSPMAPVQGGLPTGPNNPQAMGTKPTPQEIYPWMRESRHNGKQRPASSQTPGKQQTLL